jgi:transglutaminase-like putative cysteine protease
VTKIPSELLVNANSVLLDELVEVDVSEAKKMKYSSHRVVTILNKKGDRNTNTAIYYDDDRKVKDAEVFVYDALGNEIQHFRKRDFKDVSAVSGGTLYQDNRILYLDYTPSAYPYTMVLDVNIESSSTAFINPWYPYDSYAASTKKSVYKLIFDPANEPRYNAKNLDGHNITISKNTNELLFTASNLKGILYEELSPSWENITPNINFAIANFSLNGVEGVAEDWKEFGQWRYDKLIKGLDLVPASTSDRISQLVEGVDDNREKARLIYEYVQSKTRYISVQLGIGGWKPYPASDVDKLGYGDCKGLTNYTMALLKTQNIDSYYTVVWSGPEGENFEKEFASMQGDHIILNVPYEGEDIWLECTSQDIPFGFLGNFTDDRDVLVITPEGGKIEHTKEYTFEENLQEISGTITLNSEGGISSNFQVVSSGLQYDQKYRLEKDTYGDLKMAYKKRWSYINGIQIEDAKLENDKIKVVLTEKLTVKVPNYSTIVGKDWLFCANVFNQSQDIPPRINNRKQNLFIARGYKDVDRFILQLPEGCIFESLPKNKIIENKFGSYSITFREIEKDKIEYTRNLIIKKGNYPPEDYDNYRSFSRKIGKFDKTKILLTPKNI